MAESGVDTSCLLGWLSFYPSFSSFLVPPFCNGSSHFSSIITPSCSLNEMLPLPVRNRTQPSTPTDGTLGSPHAVSLSTLSHSGPLRTQRPHTPLDLDAGELQAYPPSLRGCWAMCRFVSLPVFTECFFPSPTVASLPPPLSSLPPQSLPDSLWHVCDFAEVWIIHWPCCLTLWPWRTRWPARPRTGGTQSHHSCLPRSAQRRWTARPSFTVQNRRSKKHK